MFLTVLVVLGILLLLVLDVASSDIVFGGALIILILGGIISPEEALSGFSNKGMATVGLLFIISQAVENTGIFQQVAGAFLSKRTNPVGKSVSLRRLMIRMMFPVSVLSAFLNNTPIVTIFAPVVKRWTNSQKLPASKFLIPLSYATILGGICTLIGTSTNLVVHGLMLQHGFRGFGFFELAKIGIPAGLIGYAYLASIGQKLLPNRHDPLSEVDENPKEYFMEMLVPEGSILLGKTVEQARLRNLQGVYLTDIERGELHLGPVTPDRRLAVGDRLFFAGRTDSVADVMNIEGLLPVDQEDLARDTGQIRGSLVEVIVSEASPVVGNSIKASNFRSLYDVAVIAVCRNGQRLNSRLGDIVLKPGDTLVLLTRGSFAKRYRHSKDFYLISELTQIKPTVAKKGPFALLVVLLMIVFASLGGYLPRIGGRTIDMFFAACGAALFLVVGRTITANQARSSIRWDVLITIGAAFGVSKALVNSGAAHIVGKGIVNIMAPFGPVGVLAAILFTTCLFTEIITNNAAAALVFPIAMATAEKMGIDPLPFFVAVAVGASLSFATPIGYQTNLIVQGAGGYKFRDFVKVGLPMNLLVSTASVLSIAIWYGLF